MHTLACAAREIITTVGDKMGVETILHEVAAASGRDLKEVMRGAHAFAAFMKHADRDPTAVLEGFTDQENDAVLFLACHDFGRVTGGMPIEAQVFEAWYFTTAVKKVSAGPTRWQTLVKRCIKMFPNARTAPRQEQKHIGLRVLHNAVQDEGLKMEAELVKP